MWVTSFMRFALEREGEICGVLLSRIAPFEPRRCDGPSGDPCGHNLTRQAALRPRLFVPTS